MSEITNESDILALRRDFAWLLNPLNRAVDQLDHMPFYTWLDGINDPREFGNAAQQLYYHSATFPRVIGLMLSMIPSERSHIQAPISEHAYEESAHHLLLVDWMVRHEIISAKEHLNVFPTPETSACINIGYEMAFAQDPDIWFAVINAAIELCAYKFFKLAAPKMHALGAGHEYFDVHVSADKNHSVAGLHFISEKHPPPSRQNYIVARSLEAVGLWAAMIHSWIGYLVLPQFSGDGSVRSDAFR